MALPFDELMRALAQHLGTELGIERGVYSLRVPLPSGRYQEVAVTIHPDRDGRDVIDFISTVGEARSTIDPWQLLEAAGQVSFSRITVARGIVYVIASQLHATAQPEEVLVILREVATFADELEQLFFRQDLF